MPRHTEPPIPDGNRRSSLEIMRSVLQAAQEQRRQQLQTDGGGSINVRQMLRAANLNYNQLTRYLDALEDRNLILREESDDGLHLELTENGEDFLDQTDSLYRLLDG